MDDINEEFKIDDINSTDIAKKKEFPWKMAIIIGGISLSIILFIIIILIIISTNKKSTKKTYLL